MDLTQNLRACHQLDPRMWPMYPKFHLAVWTLELPYLVLRLCQEAIRMTKTRA